MSQNQNQEKEQQWETLEPGVWKPQEAGDSIEGILIKKDPPSGNFNSEKYYIENKTGLFCIFGTTVLADRMSLANVGDHIRITYTGEEKNKKGQAMKIWKVERAARSTPAQAA